MNKKHDYTITARSRKRRARLKLEREAAKLIAEEQHRQELARVRAEAGLPPIRTGRQRTADWRARRKAKLAAERAAQLAAKPLVDYQHLGTVVNLEL